MILGVFSFADDLNATMVDRLDSLWAGNLGGPARRVANRRMVAIAASPRSPLWSVEVLEGQHGSGIAVSRLVSPTPGQHARLRNARQSELVSVEVDPLRFSSVWAAFGDETTQVLNGAYAAAIFTGNSLALLRDSFGQVPLYWRRIKDHVIFSSVFRNLVAWNPETPPVDTETSAIVRSSGYGGKGESTTVRDVRRVWPGSTTRIKPMGHNRGPEWDPFTSGVMQNLPFDRLVEVLEEAVVEGVAEATSPRESTASHLSGGIDSTLVSFIAGKSLQARGGIGLRKAYSWTPSVEGVEPPSNGESRVVRQLAEALGVPVWFGGPEHTQEYLSRNKDVDPWADLYREHLVLEDAQESRIQVILSGWGGDEFCSFGGRHYVENLFRRGEPVRAMAELWRQERGKGRTRFQLAPRIGALAVLRWQRSRSDGPVAPPTNAGADTIRYQAALRHWQARSSREIMRVMWEWGHLTRRIEHWWEAGRRHGVEYRYPLLDLRVVEAAVAIPEHTWTHHGVKRAPIRLIASRHVGAAWASSSTKRDLELQTWMADRSSRG